MKEFYRNKKVLITGHTTFIGSWLAMTLHTLEADVYGCSSRPPSHPNLFIEADIEELVNSYIGDIRDYEFLTSVFQEVQPEIVIHISPVCGFFEEFNPKELYSINLLGTLNILEACKHSESVRVFINMVPDHFRHSSLNNLEKKSSGEFDLMMGSFRSTEFLTSGYRNAYFNINKYAEHRKAVLTVRTFPLIGGGDWAKESLLGNYYSEIHKIKQNIIAHKDNIHVLMHVLDTINGLLTISKKLIADAKNNIMDSELFPPKEYLKDETEIAEDYCKQWDNNLKFTILEPGTSHLKEAMATDYFSSGYVNIFGWMPHWKPETALQKTIEWQKARERGANMQLYSLKQVNEFFN